MQSEPFDTFMDHAPVPMAILDERLRFVKVNRAMVEADRMAPEAHLGKTLAEVLPNLSSLVQPLLEKVQATGEPVEAAINGGELHSCFGADIHAWLAACFRSGESQIAFMALDATQWQMAEALQQSNRQLECALADLKRSLLFNEMSHCLQAAAVSEELYRIVGRFAPQLFPGISGALCVIDSSRNVVESTATWGNNSCEPVFSPDDCWALREGRAHLISDPNSEAACPHTVRNGQTGQICVPLTAQSEMLGFVHLQSRIRHPSDEVFSADELRLVHSMAKEIALSLANAGLREVLRQHAFRDSLTGLYNRRFLQEALDLELRRAKRNRTPVALAMLDVDGFKQFNDAHGHPAGDALLQAVATFLQSSVRSNDILCRYGGDEFCLVMPETSLEDAIKWAEKCRSMARLLNIQWQGNTRGAAVSIGIAAYPACSTSDELFCEADTALYSAKAAGRDQVKKTISSSSSTYWTRVLP